MSPSDRLLDFLLPRTCAACRLDLTPPMSGPLCGSCLRSLKPLAHPVCVRCGVPEAVVCRRCQENPPDLALIRAAFRYAHPIRQLVHAFKFRGRPSVGRALGDWMAGTYRDWPELAGADAVVPVPLHPSRLRARGFNQAALLAGAVARAAGLPLLESLARIRRTAPQWRLGRAQRGLNLDGVFRARGADLRGVRVLLVDDVCTSGQTLEGCARALRQGGVAEVRAFVLARD